MTNFKVWHGHPGRAGISVANLAALLRSPCTGWKPMPLLRGLEARAHQVTQPPANGWFVNRIFPPLVATTFSRASPTRPSRRGMAGILPTM